MKKLFIILIISQFQLFNTSVHAQTAPGEQKDTPEYKMMEMRAELDSLKKSNMENAAKIKAEAEQSRKSADMLWVTLCAALVFFMQAGFALVEAGFTRQKNTVNILMKNITDFTCGSIIFWLIGFGFMFGIGAAGFIPEFFDSSGSPKGELFAFLLFQSVFAGTATTIVSGAMAERTKFVSYIIFSVIMTGLIYPIFGNFAWKGLFPGNEKGILESMGFIDFAGSTVVHSIGAWAGLAGTLLLGPRLERYHDNKIEPIFGHNMSLAALGVFILWFGWFGFNPGSTGSIQGSSFPVIAVTTNLSASAGAISAMIFSWIVFKLPDMGITLNGILGGLVAVTAGCNNINPFSAILIGFIAGLLVVGGAILLDRLKIDDPVGAVSVHGLCGLWGTVAVGFFANPAYGGNPEVKGLFFGGSFKLLGVQLLGAGLAFAVSFGLGLLVFLALKYTIGLRVSKDEEIIGLDVLEHGNEAYPNSK